jgi:hypothetical protein
MIEDDLVDRGDQVAVGVGEPDDLLDLAGTRRGSA